MLCKSTIPLLIFSTLEILASSRRGFNAENINKGRQWKENKDNAFANYEYQNQVMNEKYDNGQSDLSLPEEEIHKLEAIYGSEFVKQHYKDFVQAGQMIKRGAREHEKIPWGSQSEPVNGLDKEIIDDAMLSAVNSPEIFSNDVREESENQVRLQNDYKLEDGLENMGESYNYGGKSESVVAVQNGHCNVHGVWLSSVAGVAIELFPIMEKTGRIEIRTKIFNQFNGSQKGILSNQWTGNGMVSRESPTTITIVFQEHINPYDDKSNTNSQQGSASNVNVPLPKTAVFVGQCLVCDKSPVLQGTWIVFPNTQNCASSAETSASINDEAQTRETLQLIT